MGHSSQVGPKPQGPGSLLSTCPSRPGVTPETPPQSPSLLRAGFHPLEAFSSREQAFSLAGSVSSRGLPGLSQVPCWSSAAIRRDSGRALPPQVRPSLWKGESFPHRSLPRALTSAGSPQHALLQGGLLPQKARLHKAAWPGPRTDSPSGFPGPRASLRALDHRCLPRERSPSSRAGAAQGQPGSPGEAGF